MPGAEMEARSLRVLSTPTGFRTAQYHPHGARTAARAIDPTEASPQGREGSELRVALPNGRGASVQSSYRLREGSSPP